MLLCVLFWQVGTFHVVSVTFYILFFIGFANPRSQLITVSSITPSLFEQLRLEHGESLSCPCSNSTMPYNAFVSNTISFHPVCSSVFVSKQWIEALYMHNASAYLVMDFRTTASSQVRHSWDWMRSFDHLHLTLILLSFGLNLVWTSGSTLFPVSRNSSSHSSQY